MPAPDPANVQSGLEWLIYIIVGAIASIGAIISQQKKKAEPAGPEFAVTTAQLADMGPVRDLAAQVLRLASAVEMVHDEVRLIRKQIEQHVEIIEGMKNIMQEGAVEAEIERRVQERLSRAKG